MFSRIRWHQYLAGFLSIRIKIKNKIRKSDSKKFLGGFASFNFGNSLGWSSPVSVQLQNNNEYFKLSLVEFGWIASVVNIGCIISALMISYSMGRFGRKRTMLMLCIPVIIGWILIICAKNFTMMLIGRLLCGFAGAYCVIGPQYTSEIAEKEIRGILGTFMQLLFVNGVLFAYIVGTFTNIFWLSVICGVVPIIFVTSFSFMPESPYFLIANGKRDAAIKALKWLRGPNYNIIKEVEEIEMEFEKHKSEQVSFKDAVLTRATLNGILISFGLMFFFNFSGMNIVHFYAKDIFEVFKWVINFIFIFLYFPGSQINFIVRSVFNCNWNS
jgi:MFS family permease